MARSAEWCPDVPMEYRGIEVCDYIAYRWDNTEGTGWRFGVDNALDTVIEAAEDVCKDLNYGSGDYYPNEYTQGRDDGKESAAEDIEYMVRHYKKEK